MALAALKGNQGSGRDNILYKKAGAITEILVASDKADQPIVKKTIALRFIPSLPAETYKIRK